MINELTLIKKLQDKTTRNDGFNNLVALYKERLYWHIRKIVLSHYDTDDVLQNTFIKVFKNIDAFKGDSKLYTWMYRIATNEAINFLNKKSRQLQITSEEVQTRAIENLKSDVYFEGETIQLLLQQAIATLPEKQKLVFNMKYFESHTFEQLSEIIGTSVGGLKSSYHIAVKKVTEYLKTHDLSIHR
ncbi:RNA polymerase sigma factor [Patiriisocius sp. Uisw_017]|jgi:RNA polymerase sigma-70 factor (ECF subfamily)|uniref:RNA polymerase sigma factor n=1 Tax=Patiriisocius sp. Uisw_017 TaxID=3230968 RepID=UPI0039ED81E5